MRKVIVCNFATLDGYYETKDKRIDPFFDFYLSDYQGDQSFDQYNTERLRAADTLLLSGRESFPGNKAYWTSALEDPKLTPIRHEFGDLIGRVEKVVVSDKLTQADLAPWHDTTRIVKVGTP